MVIKLKIFRGFVIVTAVLVISLCLVVGLLAYKRLHDWNLLEAEKDLVAYRDQKVASIDLHFSHLDEKLQVLVHSYEITNHIKKHSDINLKKNIDKFLKNYYSDAYIFDINSGELLSYTDEDYHNDNNTELKGYIKQVFSDSKDLSYGASPYYRDYPQNSFGNNISFIGIPIFIENQPTAVMVLRLNESRGIYTINQNNLSQTYVVGRRLYFTKFFFRCG